MKRAIAVPRYAELKCRTNFSFLEGASHPEEMVQRAHELGLAAIALTDRNGVYGVPKAYQAKKEMKGLKLIVGAELSLPEGGRLTLLARDRKAYGLLCRMITAAHAGKAKGEAELSWGELLELMCRAESRGLLALPEIDFPGAIEMGHLEALKDTFGERLFLPLRRHRDGLDRKRTQRALALRQRLGIPIVATNDAHYHVRERHVLQDVFTSIRYGKPLSEAGHELAPNAERYLKSAEAMARLFRDLPEAVALTAEIADSCSFCPSELRYRYPSEWIPPGNTAQGYLEKLTWEGARRRYGEGVPGDVDHQLRHELALIERLGFADYFLTIHEIVDFARSQKILCQGRGSAANSAVCYCLGITAIDPVRMELLFERFISEERGEPPDIDVDFEHERREEVIQHIYEKYGRDRAAMVSAVVTYRSRSAFREISKALGAEVGTLSARELQKRFTEASSKSGIRDPETMAMLLSHEMEGFPRHLSIHSGGFTLSADPIIEIVPIEPARMEGRTIIQWDKYDLDYLGLLKIDVLSLGMLSAIRRSLEMIGKDLYEIPPDDPETYAMIQRADTVGTFQIESRAQMSMLGRLQPRNFYDLVVEVAIMRPGPIVGKMVHPYLRRRRGQEAVTYPDEKVRGILEKTLGVPLFQEQVMKLAIALAGFTPGEADELRRAIGAWRSTGSIEKMGKRLMNGLLESGLPAEFAQRIFDQIGGFSQYGFPESHAASFALLAYASSWLKCHHPAEFACSLINSQPMGFYAIHTLVDDAKRHGVEVRPVHPHLSESECCLEGLQEGSKEGARALRLGLNVVSGLSEDGAHRWLEARRERPFSGLSDFVRRTELRVEVLQALAMGGAFECFGLDRRHSLWRLLEISALARGEAGLRSERVGESAVGTQLSLFGVEQALISVNANGPERDREAERVFVPLRLPEAIREDYETYGLSTLGHPMTALRSQASLRGLPSSYAGMTVAKAKDFPSGRTMRVAGLLIVRQKPPTAKGVTFATLEDETGFLDLVLHSPVYERYREAFLAHAFLLVSGKLQRDAHSVTLIVRTLSPLLGEGWEPKGTTYFNPLRH